MRVRQKQLYNIEFSEFLTFAYQFRLLVEELPRLKTACKPRFNTIFQRKLLLFLYLMDIERQLGKFSVRDIAFFFRVPNGVYSKAYFAKLIEEGWIKQVDHSHRRSLYGQLSPLALECITMLRRRIEAAAREMSPDAKQTTSSDDLELIDILTTHQATPQPQNSAFDFFEDVEDKRK